MRYNLTIDFLVLFQNVASDCDVDRRTVHYCIQRLRSEGVKFWTVTLPNFAKTVLYGIETGVYTREISFGNFFTAIAWKGRSLRYFRSLLDRIFCHQTGKLLPEPSPVALNCLRQLTEYCYKLAFAFNDLQKSKAEAKYLANQMDGHSFSADCDRNWLDCLRRSAETNYPYLFKDHVHDILAYGPRFGPGSFTYDPFRPGSDLPFYLWKRAGSSRTPTHDSCFNGHIGYFRSTTSIPYNYSSYTEDRVAEVLFVPKDSRGPRVISKEPPLILNAQMAFFSWMTSLLQSNTGGRIQFENQGLNQSLAKEGSVNRKTATLDLENGSDRIWLFVCKHIFRNAPGVRFFLNRARSTHFRLPSGQVGQQMAVAGMGSGLTFPLLAFMIHLSVCTFVSRKYRLSYSYVARHVYTYGDDLIVPTKWYHDAIHALSLIGTKVNANKSYYKGPFRESCGGDYLNGVCVTPVRLRLANAGLPENLGGKALKLESAMVRDKELFLVSLSAHRNECFKAGLLSTASYFDKLILSAIPYPVVGVGSPYLGRETTSDDDVFIDNREVIGPDGSVMAVKKQPYTVHFSEDCPYKFLASKLRPATSPYLYEVGTSSGTSFGEVAVPRRIKLKIQRVKPVDFLPRGVSMQMHLAYIR